MQIANPHLSKYNIYPYAPYIVYKGALYYDPAFIGIGEEQGGLMEDL